MIESEGLEGTRKKEGTREEEGREGYGPERAGKNNFHQIKASECIKHPGWKG